MTVIYENSFNWNEWFVIISLVGSSILIWSTPKIFPLLEGIAYYIFGIAYGMFYDHTISTKPWDFYDVNDNSSYQIIDFFSYVMYGAYSYFFLYLYEKLKIKGIWHLYYVLIWSCFSLLMEWIGLKIGLFHFDKGYKMYWSFPIYIIAQSMLIIFYQIVKSKSLNSKIKENI
ncbi:hypothetical protein H1D32_16945 [Anaerobacillus sp. CMMVII]|uniref:hypothetical protein n=1 Tax=Anaerobacillus sp. CMMVII TaxID=2755588 RepID=UPI0021B7E296|nr:hypothetical protein [Anaerobacillus sp. CMMVII]MCT8139241.1 hypothetical protein [Anaerobacillus sp. CMMVII]